VTAPVETHLHVGRSRPAWDPLTPMPVACGASAPGTCTTTTLLAVTCPGCLNAAVQREGGDAVRGQALRELRRSLVVRLAMYGLVIIAGIAVLAWIWSAP